MTNPRSMDKFEKVYKKLLDQAQQEHEYEQTRRSTGQLPPPSFTPTPNDIDIRRELIRRQTQQQRAAGALRRTAAQVTNWEEKEEEAVTKNEKELLDAYDKERA